MKTKIYLIDSSLFWFYKRINKEMMMFYDKIYATKVRNGKKLKAKIEKILKFNCLKYQTIAGVLKIRNSN